jgi:tetratricopeptide (TPR) repeat protein
MKTTEALIFVVLISLVLVSGCATLQAGSDVQAGRRAFLVGDNENALRYFHSAAEVDPDYVYDGIALRENIWSYLGRSEYATGRLAQARRTLEKALAPNRDETSLSISDDQDIARLYLGLTLTRSGDSQRGLKDIEYGMRGIYDDIEYVNQAFRFSYGQYWDPMRGIRSSIEGDLAMFSGKEVDVGRIISDGEWLGKIVEEEIDLARRNQLEDQSRDS